MSKVTERSRNKWTEICVWESTMEGQRQNPATSNRSKETQHKTTPPRNRGSTAPMGRSGAGGDGRGGGARGMHTSQRTSLIQIRASGLTPSLFYMPMRPRTGWSHLLPQCPNSSYTGLTSSPSSLIAATVAFLSNVRCSSWYGPCSHAGSSAWETTSFPSLIDSCA